MGSLVANQRQPLCGGSKLITEGIRLRQTSIVKRGPVSELDKIILFSSLPFLKADLSGELTPPSFGELNSAS